MNPGSPQAKLQSEYVKKWIDHYADLGIPLIRVFAGRQGAQVKVKIPVKNIFIYHVASLKKHFTKRTQSSQRRAKEASSNITKNEM